ncbi:hypothetical protein NLJ89_g251 [Agrocybe chaxingu]|uniref:pyranose dehydrogenase (acceptor) n=1 Tax=Agrocybe chaxingu TaxID=84603 RepID=A0A9W8N2B2_9AGAR|nr:hypothetical protein NLJ89_g251 [Agrocybe chaxingu]
MRANIFSDMTWFTPSVLKLAQLLATLGAVYGYVHTSGLKARQISAHEMSTSYDYIVVGGGQSGLVVANRLSENPNRSVLVVEYGYFDDNPAQVEPSSSFPVSLPQKDLFNATSVPQPGLNNRLGQVLAAAVVGGGSTINGMVFDRGSAEDYDIWERFGNPGWGWKHLLPYFKKSTTFTPPRPELAREFNITWDAERAYGNGPIRANFPDWQWPTLKIQWDAWREIGMPVNVEGAAGDAWGAYWTPSSMDTSYRRSYSRTGYWDPASTRKNLDLLIGYRVNEVLFNSGKRATAVTIQERDTPNNASRITVRATREIILCAGWLHTPQILQRSGLGPRARLEEAGVEVLVDLPGVGSNLQDHPAFIIDYQYLTDLFPNPSSLTDNTTFAAWANEQWIQRRGPLSMGITNSLVTAPLVTLPNYHTVLQKGYTQDVEAYLPKTYSAQQVKSFITQRDILLASFPRLNNGVVEMIFAGQPGTFIILMKPLSRGTTLLNTTDVYAEPIIDYNTNINPVDLDIMVSTIMLYRRWMSTKAMERLTPVETFPGLNVTTNEQIIASLKNTMQSGVGHSCCTAAMSPRELSGVVAPDLTVYGVIGLSIGDLSVVPIIPATHTCATVYAIAEKAADLIKARHAS